MACVCSCADHLETFTFSTLYDKSAGRPRGQLIPEPATRITGEVIHCSTSPASCFFRSAFRPAKATRDSGRELSRQRGDDDAESRPRVKALRPAAARWDRGSRHFTTRPRHATASRRPSSRRRLPARSSRRPSSSSANRPASTDTDGRRRHGGGGGGGGGVWPAVCVLWTYSRSRTYSGTLCEKL